MIVLLRLVFGGLLVASVVCFVLWLGTRESRWRVRGVRLLQWAVGGALVFFAVLALERLLHL